MKKIRIGNTVALSWEIFIHDGDEILPYDLTGKAISVYLINAFATVKIEDFITEDNVLSFTWEGSEQRFAGVYQLTLVENENTDTMLTFDECEAFELVRCSCSDDEDEDTIEKVELSSKLNMVRVYPIVPVIGPNSNWWVDGVDTGKPSTGMSAYEFAKEQGYEGTEAEYAAECAAVPSLNEESRTATSKATTVTEEAIEQLQAVSSYMTEVTEPTVAKAKQVTTEAEVATENATSAAEEATAAADYANVAADNANTAANRAENEADRVARNLSQISSYMSGAVEPAVQSAKNATAEATAAAEQAEKDVEDAIKAFGPAIDNKADLDNGKIIASQLPDYILGQVMFGGLIYSDGTITASSNFISKYGNDTKISASEASKYNGVYFIVTGEVVDITIAGVSHVSTGDWIISVGDSWKKIDNSDAVTSVAGLVGNVNASSLAAALSDLTDSNSLARKTDLPKKLSELEADIEIGGTSDWNASEGELGYIKNRTHFSKVIYSENRTGDSIGPTSIWIGNVPIAYLRITSDYISEMVRVKDGETVSVDHNGNYAILHFDGISLELEIILEDPAGYDGNFHLDVIEYNPLDDEYIPETVARVSEDGYLYSNGEKVDMRFTRSLLPVGTSIPAKANLNSKTYLKIGKYYCRLNVDAQTITNCPTSEAFSMEVFNPLGTNVDDEDTSDYTYRLRVLTAYKTGVQYIQYCATSGTPGSWTYNGWFVVPRTSFSLASSKNGGTAAKGASNRGVYIDSTGTFQQMGYTIAKSVPSNAIFTDTNTKVTSVGNHYAPAEDEAQQIDAPDGEVVTGLKRDAAGHVVGVVSAPYSGGGDSYDDTELRQEIALRNVGAIDVEGETEAPDVQGGGAPSATNVTYSELVGLRNNGALVAGSYYRITDYITTTAQENTQSAGHPFDVIVLALSENTLAEEAYAIQSARDTDGYFANSNLAAWKLWYSLDNDTERFAWADAENGKGVIYRMIDEWNNDCPYDFKNIQFKRNLIFENGFAEYSEDGEETWVYTFAGQSYHINNDEWSGMLDGSLESPFGHMSDENSSTFHDNTIKSYIMVYNGNDIYLECGRHYLNDIVFLGYWEKIGSANDEDMPYYYAYCCHSNSFGSGCGSNSFGNGCSYNSFGNGCSYNSFGNGCGYNSFGSACYYNSFGNGCYYNSFGNGCYYNSFGSGCGYNSFGNDCGSNSFGSACYYNSFGNGCGYNSFKDLDGIADNVNYNRVDDGVRDVELYYDDNKGSYSELRNHHIRRGVHSRRVEIYRDRDFETTYTMTSDGELREFVLGDVV